MEDRGVSEGKNNTKLWASHALVVVITVVVLVVLLTLQPWSGNPLTAVNSFRMSMSSIFTEGEISSEGLQEMAYSAPDRVHIILNPEDENQEIIIIGTDFYANDERYVAGMNIGLSISMSLSRMIPSEEHTKTTFEQLIDVKELSIERIDGVTCRHYQGSMDLVKNIEEQIASLDPEQQDYEFILEALNEQIEMMRKIETNVEIWVGKDDGFVRQIYYEAQMPSDYSESPSISSQLIKYYDINKSISIEPPLDSSGELLPGWYQALY